MPKYEKRNRGIGGKKVQTLLSEKIKSPYIMGQTIS